MRIHKLDISQHKIATVKQIIALRPNVLPTELAQDNLLLKNFRIDARAITSCRSMTLLETG